MTNNSTLSTETARQFQGVWTALITPMTSTGNIDWSSFDRLIDDQASAGIAGIVIAGTTGEAPTLTVQEKLSLFRRAKSRLSGKMRLMAGTTSSSTAQCIELSKLAAESGADSLLIATPPYNKPSLNGLVDHFNQVAQAVQSPICLYHVPARTGQMLTTKMVATLCEIESIQSVKEASANIEFLTDCITTCSSQIDFLTGNDNTFLPSLGAGAKGIISVASNVIPSEMVKIWDEWQRGAISESLISYHRIFPFLQSLGIECNPAPIKAILAAQEIGANYLRAPMATISDESMALIKNALEIMVQPA